MPDVRVKLPIRRAPVSGLVNSIRSLALASVLVLAAQGTSAQSTLAPHPVFDGGPAAGYVSRVGDAEDGSREMQGSGASADGVVTVDGSEPGTHRIVFSGNGEGRYFLEGPWTDTIPWAERDGALAMIVRVNAAPSSRTTLRMGCGHPCAADADVTRLLGALPEGEWLRISMDLDCFIDNGLDPWRVDVPFLLETSGALDLSIAGIRIEPDVGDAATVRC